MFKPDNKKTTILQKNGKKWPFMKSNCKKKKKAIYYKYSLQNEHKK